MTTHLSDAVMREAFCGADLDKVEWRYSPILFSLRKDACSVCLAIAVVRGVVGLSAPRERIGERPAGRNGQTDNDKGP